MLPPLAATRSAHVEHELIVLAVSLMKFNDISEFGQKSDSSAFTALNLFDALNYLNFLI